MGFFSGRVSFVRYQVAGRAPGLFGPDHLKPLAAHAVGKQRAADADGVEVGWIAGEHILDTRFDLAKNIVNDTLHFALRVDRQKIPADLLRAYTQIELEGLAASNPSGLPSARQKREARVAARDKLEAEAADGRFLRRNAYPVLWDGQSNELLVGTLASTAVDRLLNLFQQTFGRGFKLLNAGRQAFLLAEVHQATRGVDDAAPAPLCRGCRRRPSPGCPTRPAAISWAMSFSCGSGTCSMPSRTRIALADGSEVAVMLARTLVLECPRGQTGQRKHRQRRPGSLAGGPPRDPGRQDAAQGRPDARPSRSPI